MWSSGLVRATFALALALATQLPASSVTLASCAQPLPLDGQLARADMVFLGTVTAVDQSGRLATVQVEEIWRGPDLASVVQIQGGAGGAGFSSVDRQFEVGTRYLFAPSTDDGQIVDDACSATQPYSAQAAGLRPADVRSPIGGVPEPVSWGFATLALAGLAIAALGGFIVFGSLTLIRRRTAA